MSKHEARTSLLSGSSSEYPFPTGGYSGSMDDSMYAYNPTYRPQRAPTMPLPQSKKPSWWYLPNTPWTWAFFGMILFQAIVALSLEGYFLAVFQADITPDATGQAFTRVVPTYLALFIFGFIYQIVLTWDALRLKNTIQVIGLCLYNLGLMIEAAVQYDETSDALKNSHPVNDANGANISASDQDLYLDRSFWPTVKPLIIAVPVFVGIMTIVLSFAAYKLNDEFAWSIYKNISADLRLKKRFLTYQIYIALLKFDFFFFLAFTIQFLVILPRNTSSKNDAEFWVTVFAIPVTVAVLFLAAFFTRRESTWGMVFTIIFDLGGAAYFAYKLIRMYLGTDDEKKTYAPAKHSLTTFAVITLMLIGATITYACMCTYNFNKGLKPHVQSTRRRRAGSAGDMDKLFTSADVQLTEGPGQASRMEID